MPLESTNIFSHMAQSSANEKSINDSNAAVLSHERFGFLSLFAPIPQSMPFFVSIFVLYPYLDPILDSGALPTHAMVIKKAFLFDVCEFFQFLTIDYD